jgi:alkylation response protein AidB-like acyl-CoA dehydrogenase
VTTVLARAQPSGRGPPTLARFRVGAGLLLPPDTLGGTNAVSYGLACLELEGVDSGLRSFVSVQGSLSMFSIWRWGSPEQKQEWLPRLAAGEAIGCFGLDPPRSQPRAGSVAGTGSACGDAQRRRLDGIREHATVDRAGDAGRSRAERRNQLLDGQALD